MITAGKYTTYDSPYLDELVKGIAVMIDPKLTTSLDLFPEFEPINTTKIKWYDAKTYALEGEVGVGDWNDSGKSPIFRTRFLQVGICSFVRN